MACLAHVSASGAARAPAKLAFRMASDAPTLVQADAFRVDCVTDPAELGRLSTAWDELVEPRQPGAVFRSPAWLLPWWGHFSSIGELRTYTVHDRGTLVALLPAYRVPSLLGGRRLRLLGD